MAGIGADGWPGLSPSTRAAIAQAGVVAGAPRQLALLPGEVTARRVPLPSPLLPGLPGLLADHAAGLAVLASGDPMFYGIGATLARLLGPDRLRVLPHPSSVSLAAARLGWPLDDVDVVSLVGRPRELLHPLLQPGRRVLALTAHETAAADVRALLAARGFGASPVTVLADLGAPGERVEHVAPAGGATAAPHSRLAVVAIECRLDPGAAPLPRVPGLPDAAFEHDGQLTKRELRALALAALAPVPGHLLWDVGAGSGSIGVEWLRAHPASRAVAVEPRADRRERIARNAAALGVPHLGGGGVPSGGPGWPPPDAVFIGGERHADGGGDRAAGSRCPRRAAGGPRGHHRGAAGPGRLVAARRRYAHQDRRGAGRRARRLHRLAPRAAGRPVVRCEGEPVTVHFVGAGPGAADLITVRAQRLLERCAVCLYAGSLVPAEVLAHCPPDATLIDTADLTLDEIVAAVADADARGLDVVRLCSGDPAVFSAIAEQARRLDQAGIGYDITPGVPAFAAAAAALRRELTVPGVGQTVVLTRIAAPGHPDAARRGTSQPGRRPVRPWCCTSRCSGSSRWSPS